MFSVVLGLFLGYSRVVLGYAKYPTGTRPVT